MTFARFNEIVVRADQALLDDKGLPKRPWYKHLLYAPGLYTGYGVKTMPGAREAIEQKSWAEADVEIGRIAAAVQRETELVNRATDVLEKKQPKIQP
jgi:N-acetylated-alpha-linked acidic dipeptidase